MKTTVITITSQLARLIDVKSLVTLALVGTLVTATLSGRELSELFSNAVMLVLGFFFGKAAKTSNTDGNGSQTS